MTDAGPSVALLFDDTELVAQLRGALHECGARIVHEGGIASLDRHLLQEIAADVLVINLDEAAADALDTLYALIDGDRPRIVFNDAEASAALTGWDRARWARHLAVKIFQMGDIDPPRPADARGVEVPTAEPADALPVERNEDQPVPAPVPAGAIAGHDGGDDAEEVQRRQVETEALSAELEALLASAELLDGEAVDTDDATGDAGLFAPDGSELATAEFAAAELAASDAVASEPATSEPAASEFAASEPATSEPATSEFAATEPATSEPEASDLATSEPAASEPAASEPAASEPAASEFPGVEAESDAAVDLPAALAATVPATGLDELLDVLPLEREQAAGSPMAPGGPAAPALPTIPEDWALVDEDDIITPAAFGVEKQTAADFLAPDALSMAANDEPVLNLELVSMEEAVAPRPMRADVEMHLDELQMALSRLVLTGATLGGAGAAQAFYAALPATTQLTFLHTQHLRGHSADDLVVQLASACQLTVTLAANGAPARAGEILVAPPGHKIRIRRDARVELQAYEDPSLDPSIDESFKMATDMFGRDTLAIVFSGHSTDSIAGTKAVHAAGGEVWVETAAAEYADMVHEISGAGIVDYSGTPEEMAVHLTEKFA